MNNKGQTLVVFIIMIPIILVLTAFLIDSSLIGYEKMHLNSVTKTVIKDNMEAKKIDSIKKEMVKNGIDDNITVNIKDGIEIKFEHEIDSFFGKLISKDKYNIKVDIHGFQDGDNIKYEKGHA